MESVVRYLKNVVTLKLDAEKCIGCGQCVEVCPRAVVVMRERKAVIVDRDGCIECGACQQNCPIRSNHGECRGRLRTGSIQCHDYRQRTGLRLRREKTESNKLLLTMEKLKILFLCTGNSCRSQMAEGWARHLKGDLIEPHSAGIEIHGLDQNAVKVMAEAGVDISRQRSKHVSEVMGIPFDYVITVCDSANESCPVFPGGARRLHVSFDDPPRIAKTLSSEEKVLSVYRRVRDAIQHFVKQLPENLPSTIRKGEKNG